MPPTAEVQRATIERFIEAWKGWTPDEFLAQMSDDFQQVALPFRGTDGDPKSKERLRPLFGILMSTLTNFKLDIKNMILDTEENKACLYCTTDADTPFMPYHNEHAVFLWLDEEGQKITRIEEMFDSAFMDEFLPKFHDYFKP